MYRVVYNDGDQQDWLHHNIASLRQVFDVNNVDPEADLNEQIPPGTLYEMNSGVVIKITGHTTTSQTEQIVSFVVDDDCNASASVDLSLLKFQVAVKRKIDSSSNEERVSAAAGGSIMEWPVSSDRVGLPENTRYKVCNGLHLLRKSHDADYDANPIEKLPNVDDPRHCRKGVKIAMYDPANVYKYTHWDPSQCLVCELCGIDKDDSQGQSFEPFI